MASSKPKIVLNRSMDIPFNKLVLSQSNVRQVKAGVSIEELAEDIARRGVLHGINVRPVLDADGAETGMFEIPAGGRRYRALERLVKQKRLPKTAPVPCVVRDNVETSAREDSAAENRFREPLHPLDEFRAIRDLLAEGHGHETIAARLGLSDRTVRQRERLAKVSDKLLNIFADDGMTLEELMSFTVTDDHARQEQVWEAISNGQYHGDPYTIRNLLTEHTVEASDRRALFVGLSDYEAAGGIVMRDLFDDDDSGYLQDPALLDRLVIEKLKAEAVPISAEGWKWVTVAVDYSYGHTQGLRRIVGTVVDLTDEEREQREALRAEFEEIEEQYAQADEYPDDVDQRLGEIEVQLEAFEVRPTRYDTADIARAGAFVSLAPDGSLRIERGYVRPEDERPAETGDAVETGDEDTADGASAQRGVITVAGEDAEDGEQEDNGFKPLPDRMVTDLTAHRTLALREALGRTPHIALTALLHGLCLDLFFHRSSDRCVQASVQEVHFPIQAEGLKDSPYAEIVDKRAHTWLSDLPKDENNLWTWLDEQHDEVRLSLLAHCVSLGVNALYERVDRYGSRSAPERRILQADRIARAVGLDMVEAGWRPTVASYLGRVTKGRILEAVREAKGEGASQLIDHLKKDEMAKEAERLLDGTGWLPEPLRTPPQPEVTEDTALPDFLADDEDEVDADEPDSDALAAE
ncbi:MAG: ParB/RepB/Spo0J family partition protein [Rhizomicrobium sp.]